MSLIKLARKVTINTSHLKEDDEELMKIKTIVNQMLKQDKLVKKAQEQHENFFTRHPMLTAGIALTGGIAAADAGLNAYKHIGGDLTHKTLGKAVTNGLKEGALYGGILSAVEPAISHGIMGQREKKV
jgi:hypothetical protein